ncbi:MAG: single-stranded DNA-binding protein [Patescibacteria group bacterium]
MNLNKVYLIGRLASDPEFRTTPSGQEVATLRMATNRVWNDRASGEKKQSTEFHTIVVWGRLAQIANQYLNKGAMAMIEGRLQTRSWEGQDGVKRYRTEIVAENLQLGPKPKGNETPLREELKPAIANKEEIPVVNEDEPLRSTSSSDSEIEEDEVQLKDVPF